MGNGEARAVHLRMAVQQNIEVQGAWGVAVGAFAPGLSLQALQLVQQRWRCQGGAQGQRGVDVVGPA